MTATNYGGLVFAGGARANALGRKVSAANGQPDIVKLPRGLRRGGEWREGGSVNL